MAAAGRGFGVVGKDDFTFAFDGGVADKNGICLEIDCIPPETTDLTSPHTVVDRKPDDAFQNVPTEQLKQGV